VVSLKEGKGPRMTRILNPDFIRVIRG